MVLAVYIAYLLWIQNTHMIEDREIRKHPTSSLEPNGQRGSASKAWDREAHNGSRASLQRRSQSNLSREL